MERELRCTTGTIVYDDEVFEERNYRLHYRSTYSGKRIPMPRGLKSCARLFEDTFIIAGSYLDGWDTSEITDFSNMFSRCTMSSDFNLDALDMSSAIQCANMFREAILPANVKLNAPKLYSVDSMFYACDARLGLELTEDFCTKNVSIFRDMFAQMKMPSSFKLPNSFDTSKATIMSGMFTAVSLPEDFTFGENFDTSNVTDMNSMFLRTVATQSFKFPSKWNMKNVVNAQGLFHKSVNVINENCGLEKGFTTENCVSMTSMFKGVVFPENTKFLEKLSMIWAEDLANCFEGITAPKGFKLPDNLCAPRAKDMSSMFAHSKFADDFVLPPSFSVPSFCGVIDMFTDVRVKGVTYSTAPNDMVKNLQRQEDTVTTDQRIAYVVQAIDTFGESMEMLMARNLVCDYFHNVIDRNVPCGSDIKVFVDERYADGVRIRLKTAHNSLTVRRNSLDKSLNLDNWLYQHATYLRTTAKTDYTQVLNIPEAALAQVTTEIEFLNLVRKYVK